MGRILITTFQQFSLLVGIVILSIGFLFLFFGGTWEGAKIGLEVLGAIWILQTSYFVLVQNRKEEREKKEAKGVADKYFKDN